MLPAPFRADPSRPSLDSPQSGTTADGTCPGSCALCSLSPRVRPRRSTALCHPHRGLHQLRPTAVTLSLTSLVHHGGHKWKFVSALEAHTCWRFWKSYTVFHATGYPNPGDPTEKTGHHKNIAGRAANPAPKMHKYFLGFQEKNVLRIKIITKRKKKKRWLLTPGNY